MAATLNANWFVSWFYICLNVMVNTLGFSIGFVRDTRIFAIAMENLAQMGKWFSVVGGDIKESL